MIRRRVATPPGVPVVVDPAATLAYYRKLLDLAYAKDPASIDPLLSDLFAEGEVSGVAAERLAAATRRDATLTERSHVLELAARQVERRDQGDPRAEGAHRRARAEAGSCAARAHLTTLTPRCAREPQGPAVPASSPSSATSRPAASSRRVSVRCDCGAESRVQVQNLKLVPNRLRCAVDGCTERRRAKGAA